jgi:hypothetical protein
MNVVDVALQEVVVSFALLTPRRGFGSGSLSRQPAKYPIIPSKLLEAQNDIMGTVIHSNSNELPLARIQSNQYFK